jgi:predicted DNA repair protein MutK
MRFIWLTICTITCIPFGMALLMTMFLIGVFGLVVDVGMYGYWIITQDMPPFRELQCGWFLPMYVMAGLHVYASIRAKKEFTFPINNEDTAW